MKYKNSSRYFGIENYEETQIPLNVMNSSYETTMVFSDEVNRLDLVSLRVYNDPCYWWLIAMVNSIFDVSYIPSGLTLRIPDLDLGQ